MSCDLLVMAVADAVAVAIHEAQLPATATATVQLLLLLIRARLPHSLSSVIDVERHSLRACLILLFASSPSEPPSV